MSDDYSEIIISYLQGELSEGERTDFESRLAAESELRIEVDRYRLILDAEKSFQKKAFSAPIHFADQVMGEIEGKSSNIPWRLFMKGKWMVYRFAGACAVLGGIIFLAGSFEEMERAASKNVAPVVTIAPQQQPVAPQRSPVNAIVAAKVLTIAPASSGESATIISESNLLSHRGDEDSITVRRGKTVEGSHDRGASHGRAPRLSFDGRDIYSAPIHEPHPPRNVNSRDYYEPIDENKRTIADGEASVSTFSIDVDTGSYTNVRRFLLGGTLPPPDAVRIEEFLNYFDYKYPAPVDKPFGVSYEIAPSPLEAGKHLMKINVATKKIAESDKPWNLVFLVDTSGSMEGHDRLELLKRAFPILVAKMRPRDYISIVTYAGSSGVALHPTNGSQKEVILNVLQNLVAGGSTNGSGGIETAYALAQSHAVPGAVNRVILATDGDFNVGVTSREALIQLIETKRKSGIFLTTIGVGAGNLQEATLEQLANKGNGEYFYLDSFSEARKVFDTNLVATIETVAKDVKLQVEFNPAVVREYRLIGYDNRRLRREDFNNDTIDAGEIGAGHTVTALYELVLVGSTIPTAVDPLRYQAAPIPAATPALSNGEIGFLKVRFKSPSSETSELLEIPLERARILSESAGASDDFRFAAAVTYAGHILRRSEQRGSYSWQAIIGLAEGALGSDEQGYRREFVSLMRNAAALSR